jgi:hypothetical protein
MSVESEIEDTALDISSRIQEPAIRRLYSYWMQQRRAEGLPRRNDIDPLDFSYILGNVMLLDVLSQPLRFRFRLHGSELARHAGYDLTGSLIDDLPNPDYRSYVLERCMRLVETAKPTLVHHDRVLDNRRRRYEALWLPFSDDGASVTMLLCALIYQDS